jgi:hypothetical protein
MEAMANRISALLTIVACALIGAVEYFYGLSAAQAAYVALVALGLLAVYFAPELRRITGGARSDPSAGRDARTRQASDRPQGRPRLLHL